MSAAAVAAAAAAAAAAAPTAAAVAEKAAAAAAGRGGRPSRDFGLGSLGEPLLGNSSNIVKTDGKLPDMAAAQIFGKMMEKPRRQSMEMRVQETL